MVVKNKMISYNKIMHLSWEFGYYVLFLSVSACAVFPAFWVWIIKGLFVLSLSLSLRSLVFDRDTHRHNGFYTVQTVCAIALQQSYT